MAVILNIYVDFGESVNYSPSELVKFGKEDERRTDLRSLADALKGLAGVNYQPNDENVLF